MRRANFSGDCLSINTPAPALVRRAMRITVVLVAAVACSNPVGCDPCFTSAVVYGSVTDTRVPIGPRLVISIRAYEDDCKVSLKGFGNAILDASGGYRTAMHSRYSNFVAVCLAVSVRDTALGLETTLDVREDLDFRYLPSAATYDSVRLDITVDSTFF